MAFKFPGTPSTRAYIEELADFWEIKVLQNPTIPFSSRDIQNNLSIELDEIDHDGIKSEDDDIASDLESVMNEVSRRIQATDQKYPFYLQGTRLVINAECEERIKNVYIYLLLCTRFNMRDHKVQGQIDGTLLFEKLCEVIGKNYWGENAESMILGTSSSGNFENKVSQCIDFIGEGNRFENRNNNDSTKNDDGIDIVLVKQFSDQRPSNLIGFGQCKTGTNWQDSIKLSKIKNFTNNWFHSQPIIEPIPIAFITDTLYFQRNFVSDQRGMLVFNRFRLMEYLPDNLSSEVYDEIQRWVISALQFVRTINN